MLTPEEQGVSYVGRRGPNGEALVFVRRPGPIEEPLDIGPSLAVRRHSSIGFDWGHGSGSAQQLALAILLHCCNHTDKDHCNLFKWGHVAGWNRRGFVVTAATVQKFVHSCIESEKPIGGSETKECEHTTCDTYGYEPIRGYDSWKLDSPW